MTKQGCIKITDEEIRFVYHELEKPDWGILMYSIRKSGGEEEPEGKMRYEKLIKEYEASKRSVKASNVYYQEINSDQMSKKDLIEIGYGLSKGLIEIKNNQPCKAKVENGIALITKVI